MRKRVFTLEEVKSVISKMNGENVKLKIHLGRNRFKASEGVMTNVYPAVFTIEESGGATRTFSYFDVACGDVVCKLK